MIEKLKNIDLEALSMKHLLRLEATLKNLLREIETEFYLRGSDQ